MQIKQIIGTENKDIIHDKKSVVEIIKILHAENYGEYMVVHVRLDDGEEAQVWVGGEVEVFYHKGTIKAYVKRRKLQQAGVDKTNKLV